MHELPLYMHHSRVGGCRHASTWPTHTSVHMVTTHAPELTCGARLSSFNLSYTHALNFPPRASVLAPILPEGDNNKDDDKDSNNNEKEEETNLLLPSVVIGPSISITAAPANCLQGTSYDFCLPPTHTPCMHSCVLTCTLTHTRTCTPPPCDLLGHTSGCAVHLSSMNTNHQTSRNVWTKIILLFSILCSALTSMTKTGVETLCS